MKVVNLLHFYQPHNQQHDILNRIVNECYRPLVNGLLERPQAKLTVNISGVLTNLLIEQGYNDVVDGLKVLSERGQIEFTESSMYHAFLPLLQKEEIIRQITQNNKINKKYIGESYNPTGFFSPEMSINSNVLEVVSELGYSWVCAAEVAYGNKTLESNSLYKDNKTGLSVFFRNKRVSALILSATVRNARDLVKETQDLHDVNKYWFTVMDAETFGHHRIGHEKLLFDILENSFFQSTLINNLLSEDLPTEIVDIRPSTWTNEEQDFWLDQEKQVFTDAKSFILWRDPENPIHMLQWELTNLVLSKMHSYKDMTSVNFQSAREKLDKAIASDQYWWASAKPWWSLEMIEQGAFALKDVIMTLYGASNDENDQIVKNNVDGLYRKILDKAFEWQRTGYIRDKHVENSGTYMKKPLKERTNDEWFNQLVLEFEYEMNLATAQQDFEKAIKWRDAIIKISLGNDQYDILHVVDELWSGRNVPWAEPQVKPFLSHNWEEFSSFAQKHFLNSNTKEEFDNWKNSGKSSKTS